ncbi:MAG: zf-HC2 domain-containing protein [Elusimicrobia bacterium]|nr:zf-HC2 domain-containing protein [Elusimicrobiota bacterium]
MNCGAEMKREIMSLVLGELSAQRALAAERHLAGCRECAALRLALLEERSALAAAGAPLLSAGPAFAGAVVSAAVRGRVREKKMAFASALLAAGLAVFIIMAVPAHRVAVTAAGSAITPPLTDASYSVPDSGARASEFYYRLSGRDEFPPYEKAKNKEAL